MKQAGWHRDAHSGRFLERQAPSTEETPIYPPLNTAGRKAARQRQRAMSRVVGAISGQGPRTRTRHRRNRTKSTKPARAA